MMANPMADIGRKAKDTITGFSGTITGFCAYISGCNQYLITSKADKSGKYDANWFDVQRVVVDFKSAPIKLDNSKTPGPDRAAPIR